MSQEQHAVSNRSLFGLDYFNFCLGDLSAGVGLYLSVYLLSRCNWPHADIGIALAILPVAAVLMQIPAGILVDRVYRKRLIAAISFVVLAICCTLIIWCHDFTSVIFIQTVAGVSLSILTTVVVAITMGLVPRENFDWQIGRNGAFNNLGNVVISILAVALGFFVSQIAVFLLLAVVAIAGAFFVCLINPAEIDHKRAREMKEENSMPISLPELLSDKRLLIFSLALGVWQLANAGLCPAAAQNIAENHADFTRLSMPLCILVGQMIMIPMAILTGKFTPVFGRKTFLQIAFIILPIRAFLLSLTSEPLFVLLIQLLDGVGAGIIIVLTSIVASDLAQGTGRFNAARSVTLFAQGIGTAGSNLLAGWMIDKHGYAYAFSFLALIAVCAFLICQFGVVESFAERREVSASSL